MPSKYAFTILIVIFLSASGCGGGGETESPGVAPSDAGSRAAASADLGTANAVEQPVRALSFTDYGEVDIANGETAQEPKRRALAEAAAASSNLAYSFDGAFTSLASGWAVNWWGGSTPRYSASRETRAAHVYEGVASQRFRLDAVGANGGAHLVYSYSFAKNTSYAISINARSDVATQVLVQFRRNGAPYNEVSSTTLTLGTKWQRIDVQGVYLWGDAGSVRIIPLTFGADMYFDDMTITATSNTAPQTEGGVDLPAQGSTAVSLTTVRHSAMDSKFARFDPVWYFNAFGGRGQGKFDASRETRPDHVYAGTSSQLFQVLDKKGGDIHLIASYPFIKGKTYRASVYLRADAPTPVQVYIRMDAAPWQPIATKTVTLTTAWQRLELEGAYTSDAIGSLRVALLNATGTVWADELTISEVNKNDMAPWSNAAIPDTLFGMHVNKLGSHARWPGLGTKIVRLWNTGTTWRDLEKTNGAWDFTTGAGARMDMYVDYVLKNEPSANILYTMGQTPQWASSTPTVFSAFGAGAGGAPKNMDDWRDYVRTLARRYVGRIRYWELWNEPDFVGTYNGSWENMVELARIAKEELLAADPNNKLVGPGFTVGQGMPALDRFLSLGGGSYIDIVGFHWYYSTNPESIASSIDNVRGLMKTYGIEAQQIWDTEGAFVCNPAIANCTTAIPTSAESRSVNARAMFIMAAKGIANFNFYLWESTDPFRELVQSDYVTPTAAANAFAEARAWAAGARIVDAYRIDQVVYVIRLNRGLENFVVLWSPQGSALVNLPTAWNVSKVRTLTAAESTIPASRQLTLGIEPILLKL